MVLAGKAWQRMYGGACDTLFNNTTNATPNTTHSETLLLWCLLGVSAPGETLEARVQDPRANGSRHWESARIRGRWDANTFEACAPPTASNAEIES